MNGNRKRLREDEIGELPLSKRINNLHINNFTPGTNAQPFVQANGVILQPIYPPPMTEEVPSYNPRVHPSQSNYFYNNKFLFELYLERIQRSGQQYPW